MSFRVIVADPPWPEAERMIAPAPEQSRGGARRRYPLMSIDDICAFGKNLDIADDAWLFLWTTARHLLQAYQVMDAWGFKSTGSGMVWVKAKKGTEDPTMGMGYYLRLCHEHVLLGKRGKVKPKSRSVRSAIIAPRGAHSEKPELFYDAFEEFSDGPYLDVFSRRHRDGWTSIGNQLDESAYSLKASDIFANSTTP